MANELSLSINLSFLKSGASVSGNISDQVTVSGTKYTRVVQAVGTSDETMELGDITTPGYIMLTNLDATNYIQIGFNGSTYQMRLKAGESMLARNDAATWHFLANTATCNLEITIIED